MKRISLFLLCALLSLLMLSSCTTPKGSTEQSDPSASVPSESKSVDGSDSVAPPESGSDGATESEPEEYVFPEDGVLALLGDGSAPASVAIDGRNPALVDNKLLLFFSFANMKSGIDLADDTIIKYTLRPDKSETIEGEAVLDSSVKEIKNEYGYIGLCFDIGIEVEFYKGVNFDLSFSDKSGKEYSLKNKRVFKGLSYCGGLNNSTFDEIFNGKVTTAVGKQTIKQTGTFYGTDFTFNITLGAWAGRTTPEQIVVLSQLFWDCYPKMHARFGQLGKSPTEVTLDIENGGYEIASASGNKVHLYDGWLEANKNDYDCITHELAHVIQNGWNGDFCQYSGFIERFADACRYIYAFDDGKYNDENWTLNTINGESTLETSVRFLIWMDYLHSTEEKDLLLAFFDTCRNKKIPSSLWKSRAWDEIFEGTSLEGKTIDEAFTEYANSDFAKLSAKGKRGRSPLLKDYPIRERYE